MNNSAKLFGGIYFRGERKSAELFDSTDMAIIDLLRKNYRMQWREIGEQVHLTGQAVANRIRRMEELGLIKGYTTLLAVLNEKIRMQQ